MLPPADGYGTRGEALVQRVPKRSLQGAGEINKGMQFQARTDDGMRLFTVTAVVGDMVTLDGNHPLADQTSAFRRRCGRACARPPPKSSSTAMCTAPAAIITSLA